MKKLKKLDFKKVIAISTTVVMMLVGSQSAFAKENRSIVYKMENDKLVEELKNDSGMFNVENFIPSDKLVEKVELVNKLNKKLRVQIAEESNDTQVDKLKSVLKLKISDEDGIIFNGLYKDVGSGLDGKYIDLNSGETKTISIEIEFPAECGNDYQNLALNSKWIFNAEIQEDIIITPIESTEPVEPIKNDDSVHLNNTTPVPTGDTSNLMFYGMLGSAGLGMIGLLKKRSKKEEK